MIDARIDTQWAFLVWLAVSGFLVHRLSVRVGKARRSLVAAPASERRRLEDVQFRENGIASFRVAGWCAFLWLVFDWLY